MTWPFLRFALSLALCLSGGPVRFSVALQSDGLVAARGWFNLVVHDTTDATRKDFNPY